MNCPNCNKIYDDDFKFCPYCGEEKPEPKICPNCELELSTKFHFCPECGTKLAEKEDIADIQKNDEKKIPPCEIKDNEENNYFEIEQELKKNHIIHPFTSQIYDKNLATNYYNSGIYYSNNKNLEKAIECFENCLNLDENFSEAKINLIHACILHGNKLGRKKNFAEAIKFYKKLLELNPDSDDEKNELVRAYKKAGNKFEENTLFAEAIKFHDKALELNPNSYDILIDKASTLLKNNQENEAIQNFNQILKQYPDKCFFTYSRIKGTSIQEIMNPHMTRNELMTIAYDQSLRGIETSFIEEFIEDEDNEIDIYYLIKIIDNIEEYVIDYYGEDYVEDSYDYEENYYD